MDLQTPTAKMSKSSESPPGTVLVLDPPDVVMRKFKRAVTDSGGEVGYDPEDEAGRVATCCRSWPRPRAATPKALAPGSRSTGR